MRLAGFTVIRILHGCTESNYNRQRIIVLGKNLEAWGSLAQQLRIADVSKISAGEERR